MINSINFSYSLSERIFLELVLSEINDEFIYDYVRNLIYKSKVKKRQYDNGYGMYLDFEKLEEDIIHDDQDRDIPILLSADFNFNYLDDAAFFMLYLTEDRKNLNFLEVSMCFDNFNEEIMALTILEHLLSKK